MTATVHPAPLLPAYRPIRDTRGRAVLAVAIGLSALYAVGLLLDLVRPRVAAGEPALGLLLDGAPVAPLLTMILAMMSWVFAAVMWVLAAALRGDPRWAWWREASHGSFVLAGVLVSPWLVLALSYLVLNPLATLACLPPSALALLLVTRLQRFGRMPRRLGLAAVGWGALVAVGFASAMNLLYLSYAPSYLAGADAGLGSLLAAAPDVAVGSALHAGIVEELAKGLGVALAYVVARRHLHDVVSGVVFGALVGLGFNLNESIQYMSVDQPGAGVYAFFGRQSLGLLGAHLAFTAAVGAGFGIAARLRDPGQRRLAIGGGFVIAGTAHFASNVLLAYYGRALKPEWEISDTVDTLVMLPLLLILLQGPFVLLYLMLVRRGLTEQARAMTVELCREARLPDGAVAVEELGVLLDPRRRFGARIQVWRSGGGPPAYRLLDRLQQAQLAVGMQRWQRSRGDLDSAAPPDGLLRERVRTLRAEYARGAGWRA